MGYTPKVAVVGGGISGLVFAQELSSRGILATVFDTGEHACGGRMSTRDAFDPASGEAYSFDHSTQYFTATVHLIRAWYCMGEYMWCGVVGGEMSSTCTRVFHFLE